MDEDKVELGDPKVVDSEVPGVDVSKLTADQKDAFKKKLGGQYCTCGCKRNLLDCRINDRSCAVSKKLASEQLEALLAGKSPSVASAPAPVTTTKGNEETNAPPPSK